MEQKIFKFFFSGAVCSGAILIMFLSLEVMAKIAQLDNAWVMDRPCSGKDMMGVAFLIFLLLSIFVPEIMVWHKKKKNKIWALCARRPRPNRRKA